MEIAEKISSALRHNKKLENLHWLWNGVRPVYNRVLALANRRGLKRNINGTDRLRVSPRARGVVEEYEPEVWRSLMADLRAGDTVADVGAFIGLYTIALAQRVGREGRVVAFEPDAANFGMLKEHARLNYLRTRIETVQAVVGTQDGETAFESNGIESHAVAVATPNSTIVKSVSLDKFFANRPLNILKIDVEGYEEKVLQGATALLGDPARRPRVIYIEVHPYAWPETGASSESLLGILRSHGYEAFFIDGKPVDKIEKYGEIAGRRTEK